MAHHGTSLVPTDMLSVSLGEFARGVHVGSGARLPRQPALYPAKKKGSLKHQYDGEDYLTTVDDEDATWRKNYSSLEPWKEKVLVVMEDQTSRGQVLKLTETEARLRFPDLVVASLGIRKDKPSGVVTARVLFDGTNGIYVNRTRDQERSPIAADLKRLIREKSQRGRRTFALTADVAEAHRQVPINPRNWHLLGCQVESGGAVYVHTVGTFGVASASYYWSRVAGAIGRVTQYCSRSKADTWHVLVADDFHLEAGGPECRPALLAFFVVCVIAGVPLCWPKTAGGDVVSWVGFELLHSSYQLGISERRAAWFVKWTRTTAEQETVHMAKFEEGLGRVMFATGALEHQRPFMAPLYKFMISHPRHSVQAMPSYVSFFFRFLARQVEQRRHYPCAVQTFPASSAPRVDGQASAERTGIGGWLPSVRQDGTLDLWTSRWFSLELKRESWPWVYEISDKPSLLLSTLEALAVLFSLILFFDDIQPEFRTKVQVAPTWTGNRGNGSALNKLMTSRVSTVEAEVFRHHAANREADRLANGITQDFNPAFVCVIDLVTVPWILLPRALDEGGQAEQAYQDFRASGRDPQRSRRQRRGRPEERLRMVDPW